MAGTQDAMTPPPVNPRQQPHPVVFDVEYPERLSRLLIFVKIFLAIPHFVILYVLSSVSGLLTFIAWFAILFTGRYPKSLFDFNLGIYRWGANVGAYVSLLRDEYPPFSIEGGQYAATLEIPYPERQSRFRLFIRYFAIIPNWIVFWFVSVASLFTTFISWWAILFTGRYPRGLFNFSVGVMRWQQRQNAYLNLLRDEYPPYSIGANARPGNEVLSTIIGIPLMIVPIGLLVLLVIAFGGGSDNVRVRASLETPGALSREEPTSKSGSLRITLLDYDDDAAVRGVDVTRGYRLVSFDVRAEKDGFWPAIYAPFLFFVDDCAPSLRSEEDTAGGINSEATEIDFDVFWRDGEEEDTIYFEIPESVTPCQLSYFNWRGFIEFEFR